MAGRLGSLVGSERGGGRVEVGGLRVEEAWRTLERVLYEYRARRWKGRGL